jgi:hypothetical protein
MSRQISVPALGKQETSRSWGRWHSRFATKDRRTWRLNLLAVKAMQLKADLRSEDHDSKRYVRELEALAKFTQGKVSWVTTLFHSLLMLSAVCASLCENIRLVSRWGLALHLHGALQALGPWNLLENSHYCVRRNSQGDCSASPPRAVQNA